MNFMQDRVFVDTNILVYAHDRDAGAKYEIARRIVVQLWEQRTGAVSIQVLQEFYINITRKITFPLSPPAARELIQTYFAWYVAAIHPQFIIRASEISERNKMSFWDALIVVAAQESNADKILTEDLNSGQTIEGVLIVNPFVTNQLV